MLLSKSMNVAIAMLIAGSLSAGWGPGGRKGSGDAGQTEAITSQDAAWLSHLREEEKVARDVYDALYQTWGMTSFDNISSAEQHHMDAVLQRILAYGLVDPAQPQPGVFTDAGLQQLYDTLVGQGRQSQLDALMTGALIEEVDMQDLDEMTAATSNPALIDLYGKLHCGSRNHLRAFVRQIENRGLVYAAQVLSQEAVDQIVDTPMERRCGAR